MSPKLSATKNPAKYLRPIDYPMVAEPHRGIYKMHQYRARKPENVVRDYIKHYTKEGDIVLDPFVGSGVTAVEAVKLGRKGVAIDLDPMATFITRMTTKPIDLTKAKKIFKNIESRVKDEILKFYETRCPKCKKIANISHVVWNENEPTQIWYDCSCSKKRLEKNPDKGDFNKIRELNSKKITYWYPKTKLYYEDGSAFLKGEKLSYVYELFTKRNLLALSLLYHEIELIKEDDIRDLFKFVFTQI